MGFRDCSGSVIEGELEGGREGNGRETGTVFMSLIQSSGRDGNIDGRQPCCTGVELLVGS